MNLSSELLIALDKQYAQELQNHRLYLCLAAPLDAGNVYLGCAKFFNKSAMEEIEHARLFYDYINDRNEQVYPPTLTEYPRVESSDPAVLFEAALEAEVANSEKLLALYDVADVPTKIFLQPILMEQVKSERELTEIIAQLDAADGNMAALFEIDERLGGA
jgi:ferritin